MSVTVECDELGVALVRIGSGLRGNAWSLELESQFHETFNELDRDGEVRAIVVAGEGTHFCAGANPEMLEKMTESGAPLPNRPSPLALLDRETPIIAAIHGACAGAGLVLALTCDLRFATTDARISTAYTRRGLAGEYAVTWMLSRTIGWPRASDLLLSGRVIDGAEALRLGLVNFSGPSKTAILDSAISYGQDLARHTSPAAVALMRQQLLADYESGLQVAARRSQHVLRYLLAEKGVGPQSLAPDSSGRRFPKTPPEFSSASVVKVHDHQTQEARDS